MKRAKGQRNPWSARATFLWRAPWKDSHAAGRTIEPYLAEIRMSSGRIEFGKITYDSWGSMESIQILQSQGYEADTFSVDKTTDAYETLKTAIYDGRVYCYRVPKLEQELTTLELDEKRQKIDHPPNGSKDLADALAGAVFHCEQAFHLADASAMRIRPGIVETDKEELQARFDAGLPLTEEEFDRL